MEGRLNQRRTTVIEVLWVNGDLGNSSGVSCSPLAVVSCERTEPSVGYSVSSKCEWRDDNYASEVIELDAVPFLVCASSYVALGARSTLHY